jgi:long-chain acyl-CoA synthetase
MQTDINDEITPQQAGTLHGLFIERVRRTPDKVAYRFFERNNWRDITWREMEHEVARWQAALVSLKLQRGDRVALMLRNCPCWMILDQAAMSLGLAVVPLYTVDRPDNIAYIANDADVKVLVFESAEQWQALRMAREQMAGIARFVSLDEVRDAGEPRLVCMAEFLPAGAVLQPEQPCPADTLASIIYTSGTTGKPKGVMLSHANMLINAHACLEFFPVGQDDLLLSFLPLSHTFERTVGYYLTVMAGATVAFARSIPQLSEDLRTIHPTLLISVPRIYERIYGTVQTALRESTPLKRGLFNFTVETGWARFLHQQGRGSWQLSFLLWPLLHRLVAQTVLNHLGGRLRVALSGGAALAPEISRMFIGLGLPVIQGYGLTETSPVISANRLDNNFPDSVGLPISGIEVRRGEQGELLVKGPNVMLGYWNNPAATRAIIDADGWLNTGDVVRISDTGHIYITGRTKEIIVMSNGEKVPPLDMEHAILRDPLFDQVMVIGEARPHLAALVVLNPDEWPHFAQEIGIRPDMPEALHDSRVESRVLKRIALNLRDFPGYANVRRVLLLTEPWSVDNGLLTPTLKLMRPKVAARFAEQIEAFYARH